MEGFQKAWISLEKVAEKCRSLKEAVSRTFEEVEKTLGEFERKAEELLAEMRKLEKAAAGLESLRESGVVGEKEYEKLRSKIEERAIELQKAGFEVAVGYNKKALEVLKAIKKLVENEEEWTVKPLRD